MALLGSDFDAAVPADAEARSTGASRIRDIKTRLKAWATVMFDLDTGNLKSGVVTGAMLENSGATAGTYIRVTIDAKGRATNGSNTVTTLAEGGTGLGTTPTNGQLLIGNGSGYTLASPTGATNGNLTVTLGSGTISLSQDVIPFCVTGTLTSAAAATPVVILPDTSIPTGKKVYVTGVRMKVNGATLWATTATVKVQDTSAVDFVTTTVAALTANAYVSETSANVTAENAMALGTGGTATKGLQIKGDANGTGSNLVVTVFGVIK